MSRLLNTRPVVLGDSVTPESFWSRRWIKMALPLPTFEHEFSLFPSHNLQKTLTNIFVDICRQGNIYSKMSLMICTA